MTSTLGGITLGALAASYVTLSSPLEFVLGKGSKIALQADVLDVILKNILPLSMVLLSVYLPVSYTHLNLIINQGILHTDQLDKGLHTAEGSFQIMGKFCQHGLSFT